MARRDLPADRRNIGSGCPKCFRRSKAMPGSVSNGASAPRTCTTAAPRDGRACARPRPARADEACREIGAIEGIAGAGGVDRRGDLDSPALRPSCRGQNQRRPSPFLTTISPITGLPSRSAVASASASPNSICSSGNVGRAMSQTPRLRRSRPALPRVGARAAAGSWGRRRSVRALLARCRHRRQHVAAPSRSRIAKVIPEK